MDWLSALVLEPKERRAVDGYGRRVIEIIQAGIASRQLARSNDPYLLMSIILGSMTHLVAACLLYGKPYDLQAQGERALALLLPAIVPADGRTRLDR